MQLYARTEPRQVSFSGKNTSLETVFNAIKKQTGYAFSYQDKALQYAKKIKEINLHNVSVTTLLDVCFQDQPLTYEIVDKTIQVKLQAAQQNEVRGQVTDSAGNPLAGVAVKLVGTSKGTVTDEKGAYAITANTGDELEFSYIGFVNQRATVNGATVNIHLVQQSSSTLNEVIVVGYGTVKKKDLTGAVSSLKAEDITLTPTANVMDAVQGKAAGVDILKSSGKAGSGVNVVVRGNRSIYGDNTPLYIIDGIAGDYSKLNPNDIESIDILKDASSTAIYGSAGSNGVVIITTKKGKNGKAIVDFDSYFGYNGFPKYPHGLTGDSYIKLKREAYRTEKGDYPEFNNDIFTNPDQLAAYNAGEWVDWVDLALRNALTQNYSASVRGGNEKSNAYLSINYNDEQGLIKNDKNKKYALRSNINYTISKTVKVGANIQFTYTNNDQAAQNIFGNSLTFIPLGIAFDSAGNINHVPVDGVTNPLSDQIPNQYRNNTLTMYFAGNAFIDYNPFKGFTYRSIVGTTLSSARNGKYFGTQSIANPEAGFSVPAAVIDNTRDYNYRWENILGYDFSVHNEHHFNLTAVSAWTRNQSEDAYEAGSGFDMDSYSFYNMGAATKTAVRSSYIQTQSLSFVGRINYNYKGKYLLSLSNRWDGVSRLSEGHKWDAFPAGAAAWRISDEGFFRNVRSISSLKLRVGYGVTGNAGGVGAYATQGGGYNAPKPVGFGLGTLGPAYILNQQLANTDLGWEKSYNTNIGMDVELFNGVVNFTADWYNTDTKNLLFLRSMPASLGGSWGAPFSMWQNIGATNNKGLELLITTQNVKHPNFSWSTTLTFAANKEKITSLPGNKDLIASNLFMGHPVNTFYDYKYEGIWQQSEADEAAKYNSKPGDIKLATDGTFTAAGTHAYGANDKQILGSGVPKWTGGLQNTFQYKNFDLVVLVTGRWGQMMASNLITRYDPTTGVGNSPDDINYWLPENPNGYLPRPGLHSATSGYIGFSALKYVDGSYLKLRNVTLGYTLPKSALDHLHIQRLRLYATANNPYIYTKSKLLKYQDPETNGSDNFPLTKQFVFGLNVTF